MKVEAKDIAENVVGLLAFANGRGVLRNLVD